MQLSNAHTHSQFCDGCQSAAQMAQAAFEQGFIALGFSGHAYTPFDTSFCMTREATERYIAEVTRLKELYRGRMAIFCGLEADAYCVEDISRFDYIIGSVHYLQAGGRFYSVDNTPEELAQCIKRGYGGDALAMLADYYRVLAEMVERLHPQIIGHFDLPRKLNGADRFFAEESGAYLELAEQALAQCAPSGALLELNTGGIYRGYRDTPYPAAPLLSAWREQGGKVIITSDAHDTAGLAFRFGECRELLRELGFKEHYLLTPQGFAAAPL